MIPYAKQLWKQHTLRPLKGKLSALYIDKIVLHERTGGIALKMLSDRGLKVRKPHSCIATLDHIINTNPCFKREAHADYGNKFIGLLRDECEKHEIRLFDLENPERGISHILAIEQGFARPGLTLVCPDSHVSTVGAVGALGLAVGSSECQAVLASQTLVRQDPLFWGIELSGKLPQQSSAKDIALALLKKIGPYGAQGYILEFQGSFVQQMTLAERLTLCNLAAETGAETAIIGSSFVPEVCFDRYLNFDISRLAPQITWGTHPSQVTEINAPLPQTASASEQDSWQQALRYMDLKPGEKLAGQAIQGAFIGSCGNASLEDIQIAAKLLKGKKIASDVQAFCVPASETIRIQAEALELHKILISAGFAWHYSGCASCNSFNSPFKSGDRVISTSNRNFEGRQGHGVRTHLASPAVVVSSALRGEITEPATQ